MKVVFVPEAKDEFLATIRHYEDLRSGLGERFKDEADRCILWIADHPELYRLRPSGYRRINLRDFLPHSLHHERLEVVGAGRGAQLPKAGILDQAETRFPIWEDEASKDIFKNSPFSDCQWERASLASASRDF